MAKVQDDSFARAALLRHPNVEAVLAAFPGAVVATVRPRGAALDDANARDELRAKLKADGWIS